MYTSYYMSGNSTGWLEGYTFFNMTNVNFGPATLTLLNQSSLASPSQQAVSLMENTTWPIYVVNSNTIAFHLESPFAYFLGTIVTEGGLIYDSQWVFDNGGLGTPASPNSYFNQHPIPGTGPYEFSTIAEDNYAQFVQNPTYWGKSLNQSQIAANPALDPGHVKNVIIYYKPDDLQDTPISLREPCRLLRSRMQTGIWSSRVLTSISTPCFRQSRGSSPDLR